MIRLFRKIRHQLLAEEKYSIYLLYASGEILLVVTGILLALQIDNWNEIKKIEKEEQGILINLQDDLIEAKNQSTTLITDEAESKELLISALSKNALLDNLLRNPNPDSIFIEILWNFEQDAPVIRSFSEIKHSGKTGLITNQKIRQRFISLEMSINTLNTMLSDRQRVHQLRIDDIVASDVNFVRMASVEVPTLQINEEPVNDYGQLLGNQRIRNLLAIKLTLCNNVLTYRRALDEEINSLLILLEDEIEGQS